jgi:hypothetical protein
MARMEAAVTRGQGMNPLLIRSWFLARFLGVTDRRGIWPGEYMPVRLEAGGPQLWWRMV